jgi:hypothetical protein
MKTKTTKFYNYLLRFFVALLLLAESLRYGQRLASGQIESVLFITITAIALLVIAAFVLVTLKRLYTEVMGNVVASKSTFWKVFDEYLPRIIAVAYSIIMLTKLFDKWTEGKFFYPLQNIVSPLAIVLLIAFIALTVRDVYKEWQL